MRSKTIVILIICFALLSITATLVFYSHYMIYDAKELALDVKVADHMGFNTDTDALHFGIVKSPGAATRFLNISHKYTKPLQVNIQVTGIAGSWLFIENSSFYLEPNISIILPIEINVPENIPFGQYNGSIRVMFKRSIS
ncbi:MAG: hypothetical protein ABIG95_04510 [Candidatus Woesearchaeota archaeon]